jgi:hypothetical protein
MKKKQLGKRLFVLTFSLLFSASVMAQKPKPKPAVKAARSMIFAVLNDGKTLEPIAYINKGKLEAPVDGSDPSNIIAAFNRTYYKPGTVYRLIFGSADAGTVTVRSSDHRAECSRNMAAAATRATRTPLKGLVMGLATNAPGKAAAAGVRRKPSTAEKDEIEALVRAEFTKQKLTPKTLRYHNLTALDLNNDGDVEFVGSYWVEIDKLTRGLLFFIAGKGGGKYSLGYSEYRMIDQEKVMSGEIKSVDDGVYHELLLDAFDYDADGISNIFTYVQSFEGAGFNAYSRSGNKWVKSFEGSNYHCGY